MNANRYYRTKNTVVAEPAMISEATLMRRVLVRASELGARLFRNNTGRWRLAQPECRECQSSGRVVASGLCIGSSDLIGWRSVVVTPAMVGRTLAVFVAVELKVDRNDVTEEQSQFLEVVDGAGGIGVVVRDVESLPLLLS